MRRKKSADYYPFHGIATPTPPYVTGYSLTNIDEIVKDVMANLVGSRVFSTNLSMTVMNMWLIWSKKYIQDSKEKKRKNLELDLGSTAKCNYEYVNRKCRY